MHRGATAEIDLNGISHNLDIVRRITGNSPVIAVVKADAYGHGAVEVSERLVEDGVYCLAVAFMDEAVQLRDAGIRTRIIVLFEKHDLSGFFEYNLTPVIHDYQTVVRLSEEARKRNRKIDVHIKVDTGMGRLGLGNENVPGEINAISKMDYINVTGLMSHFSEANLADRFSTNAQIRRFNAVRESLTQNLKDGLLCHIANSAATISFSGAHMDAVRPGIMLYGVSPIQKSETTSQQSEVNPNSELSPAMTVKTEILALRRLPEGSSISYGGTFITRRDSMIAVIPVGYADGYSRLFSNNADVLIGGKRAPVAGRVCMDLTMLDVTGIEGVTEGDEVVLLGRQGSEEITAEELAVKAGTIPYEILTSLGNRSKRIYKGVRYFQDKSLN